MHRMQTVSRAAISLGTLLLASFTLDAAQVIDGPTLTMDPNGKTPLAGVVEMTTDELVQARLTITHGSDTQTVLFPEALQHYLPVLGLKEDRTYTVDVELVPGGLVGSLFATTDPLPGDFPSMVTSVSTPDAEPGYLLIDCFRRGGSDARYVSIVDPAGEVVWFMTACVSANIQLPNGNLFYRRGTEAVEMDLLGNEWTVQLQDPGVGLHHDLQKTPHGTYLSLSRLSVEVEDFPTSYTDPDAPTQTAIVRDEPVVEFLPDGTLRREWRLLEMLDPTRIAYDSLNSTSAGLDWVHTNAVVYNPDDDSIVVSARHQDAVFGFSRETGDLVWVIGPHDNWSSEFQPYLLHPVGSPFRWQFHQHAPMWTSAGTLVIFDNGNRRASPFDGTTPWPDDQNFSRAVEYEIDLDHMEVRQVWEYGENAAEQLYSYFISDADWLPVTGNRLSTFGGISYVDGVASADLGRGQSHTRIIETTDDPVAVVVFDLALFDPGGGRINVYRSEKIPSLYPQQYFKSPNGVGETLRVNRVAGLPELSWQVSPTDDDHDAADYYIAYVSSSPSDGFAMVDSTAHTSVELGSGPEPLVLYKIVAANSAGTSGDEPAP